MKGTMSSRGRVTIPVEVRNRLGLVPGTEVELELRAGEVVLRKALESPHPVDRVFGILKLDEPVDGLLDEMRGRRGSGQEPSARRASSQVTSRSRRP